jgi:outer membrane protein OmpA-like peptidoglycan-associated protein
MKLKGKGSFLVKTVAMGALIAFACVGCAASGKGLTDTGTGAIAGSVGGAILGGLIYEANPVAGVLIGAAGGALIGGVVGHFMDERKKDLEKDLAPQINAGQITVKMLPGNALQVTSTGETAFAPGSSVVSQGFIPTLQTIAKVVRTYGKTTITVLGHPDAKGTVQERATLANQRAEAVRNLLLGMGVPPILVSASGNQNSNYMDGRVELVIHPVTKG